MKQQLFESDRISIKESPDELEIIISGNVPKNQFVMLSAWLIAWTFAGGYVISQLFTNLPDNTRIFMFVWLVFWFYFEYKVGSAWLWRKYGREVLRMRADKTELRFEVAYGGRASEFNTSEIRNLSNMEQQKGVFVKNYYSSFWVVGGETIGFYYQGKLYLLGRQISQKDTDLLMQKIGNRLRKWAP
ncbi:MAG TPA: hypothetical protein PL185_00920 [Flavobacteriales bacterium]|nr:hypothetical protein [Flavobacteriales bacterium]HPH81102.1 hypothetical protein [Flavobacteriales bacterium]